MAGEGDFWPFALALYRQPGVERACISLQDDAGVNVVFLLFCCWLGARKMVPGQGELSRLLVHARRYSDQFITPLRRLRRRYRATHTSRFDETLYRHLKETELAAEQALGRVLEQQAASLGGSRDIDPGAQPWRDNCHSYLQAASIALDERATASLETVFTGVRALVD